MKVRLIIRLISCCKSLCNTLLSANIYEQHQFLWSHQTWTDRSGWHHPPPQWRIDCWLILTRHLLLISSDLKLSYLSPKFAWQSVFSHWTGQSLALQLSSQVWIAINWFHVEVEKQQIKWISSCVFILVGGSGMFYTTSVSVKYNNWMKPEPFTWLWFTTLDPAGALSSSQLPWKPILKFVIIHFPRKFPSSKQRAANEGILINRNSTEAKWNFYNMKKWLSHEIYE